MAFLYLLTNLKTGKRYVGQTRQAVTTRWRQHRVAAFSGTPACRLLYAAIRKYGPDAFEVKTIALSSSLLQSEIDAAERQLIASYGTLSPSGYNLRAGGAAGAMHPETKARIAAAHRGREKSPAWRAKISALHTGRRHSAERIDRMRAGRRANGGWGHTDATIQKMSASKRGRPQHPNTAAALRKAHVGAKRSPEARARISAGIMESRARRAAAALESTHA